jgi:c-di-GMP-binding flagellar brake protein YcgR
MVDRRDSPRLAAALNAQIETDTGRMTIALTQDLSATGVAVLSHQALPIGGHVTIHVLLGGDQYVINGKVVREVPLADSEKLWRSKAAVSFDGNEAGAARLLALIAGTPYRA